MLHAHLEVKALPHTTLTRLRQLSCCHWLIVGGIEKLPQKLPTLQHIRSYYHTNYREGRETRKLSSEVTQTTVAQCIDHDLVCTAV